MSPHDFPTDEELGIAEVWLACGHLYPADVDDDHDVAACLAGLEADLDVMEGLGAD